jgi:hypothetical protein
MNDTIELLTRTLCDLQPKNPANGVYLYCQTKSNQQSINRVAGGLSPPAPTPPGKRVRTGRFT